jgi:predicted helicase
MGEYEEFEHICFVDTLDHAAFHLKQMNLFAMSVENTQRIQNQNDRNISVIIGNPSYNANQQNENDNNKNRKYPAIDKRIKDTYVKESTAQKTKVYDPYSRFFRWATDRLGENGIISFITNSSFINAKGFDGFRKSVVNEFDYIYTIDLGGDIREGDTTGNVFNIITGVAITFMIKIKSKNKLPCQIMYCNTENFNSAQEKLDSLAKTKFDYFTFEHIKPDHQNNWVNLTDNDFDNLISIADKKNKSIFEVFSNGVATNRDEWVYDIDLENLENKSIFFIDEYNHEVKRWIQYKKNNKYQDIKKEDNPIVDKFIAERNLIKWSSRIKRDKLRKEKTDIFNREDLRESHYRPFVKRYIYFSYIPIDIKGSQHLFFSKKSSSNHVICFANNEQTDILVLAINTLCDLNFCARGSSCFALYTYDENGNRVDNITDWGLQQFQNHYKDKNLTKLDIFHYTYGVLHNPEYRTKYELNLKRKFPRLPFYDNFSQWVEWGSKLMELHINYETVAPYPLTRIDTNNNLKPKTKLKADREKNSINLDDITFLQDIPKIAWEYKLGNRSALEWILDQYKEKKPKDKTIAERFNNYRFADYKETVIDLLQRVCTVSVETMKIIEAMKH